MRVCSVRVATNIRRQLCNIIRHLGFFSNLLKGRLLGSSENPFQSAYVVDVQVETVDGRPALYKVIDIHDTISRSGAEDAA